MLVAELKRLERFMTGFRMGARRPIHGRTPNGRAVEICGSPNSMRQRRDLRSRLGPSSPGPVLDRIILYGSVIKDLSRPRGRRDISRLRRSPTQPIGCRSKTSKSAAGSENPTKQYARKKHGRPWRKTNPSLSRVQSLVGKAGRPIHS